MDLYPRGTPATRGNRGKSSLLPRNSFRGGPPNNFCPPPLHVNSQGPPIPSRGLRDHSLVGAPPMIGPPGNLDSIPGRSNFGRGDRLSMGVPERGPLRNRDFAPSPPREMRRDYRNESHDYERSGLLPHDYDSYRNYGPHDFTGPPAGNYSFYGPSSTSTHFNYMHDQKMQADEPGGYAIPFHGTNNANDLYPNPQITYNMNVNKLPTKRKAQVQPFTCSVCNVTFNSDHQAAQHFSSARHVKKMRLMEPGKQIDGKDGELDATGDKNSSKKLQLFTCDCCKITVNSLHQLDAHKSGSKHQSKISQGETGGNGGGGGGGGGNQMETEDDHVGSDNSFDKKTVYTCSYCNVTVNSLSQLDAHKAGSKHQNKLGLIDPSKQMEMDEDQIGSDFNSLSLPSSSFDKKNVFSCEYCKVTVNSLHQLEAHKNGNKHQNKVSLMESGKPMENNDSMGVNNFDKKNVFTCECCNVNVNSLQQLEAHKSGSKHQSKLLLMDPAKQMETNFVSSINNLKLPASSEKKQSFTCVYCNISVNSLQQLEAHMSGSKHQAKLQKAQEEK